MNNYGYRRNKTSLGEVIIMVIFVIFFIAVAKSCSRSDANMILINDRYVYDAETNIVYIEMETGRYGTRTVYTEYYNENGNLVKYNLETGEFEEIINPIDQ